jgi:hypothetical protein
VLLTTGCHPSASWATENGYPEDPSRGTVPDTVNTSVTLEVMRQEVEQFTLHVLGTATPLDHVSRRTYMQHC